jgi:hypothetical protein
MLDANFPIPPVLMNSNLKIMKLLYMWWIMLCTYNLNYSNMS